jgi:hypothetical protein
MKRMIAAAVLLFSAAALGADEPVEFPPLLEWVRTQETRDWVSLLERANDAPVTGVVAVVEEIRITIPETVRVLGLQYAATMQAYFGAGAHTNRSISYDLAAGFFIGRVPFSVEDARAVLLLTQAIPVIRQFAPDNTCWTFPFGELEMVKELSGLRPLYGLSAAHTVLGRPATREDILAVLGALQ